MSALAGVNTVTGGLNWNMNVLVSAVRLARALAPKSSVFGLFGLGPASRGSATISDSRSHGVDTIAPPSIAFTHSHSLLPLVASSPSSATTYPWTPTPITLQSAHRHSKTGRASPRLVSPLTIDIPSPSHRPSPLLL
ncbi:hypothetical protein EDB89DRAFT_2226620 [Lactarius sanguifluus]|nr:hypothetical protein EDB89DRAFT_2226620 [Lactarius sanguifluus]